MFSLESPHRGDSNEYTQYTIFNIKKKITVNYPNFAVMGFFSKGLENGLETAVVNKPSVFEPLKVYCISCCQRYCLQICTLMTVHVKIYFCHIHLKIIIRKKFQ